MSSRPSLPRASKVRALAKLRVHCPPLFINLWDRLPGNLQTRIKEMAVEDFCREQTRKVHVQLLLDAHERKLSSVDKAYAAQASACERVDGVQAAVQAQQEVRNLLEQHGYFMNPDIIDSVMGAYRHAFAEYRSSRASYDVAWDEYIATSEQLRQACKHLTALDLGPKHE
jgi:hypothetical protein